MNLTPDPCGCVRYPDGERARTCVEHTPVTCWNCDWPTRAESCPHCGVGTAVRRR